jgi:hypothetical protein
VRELAFVACGEKRGAYPNQPERGLQAPIRDYSKVLSILDALFIHSTKEVHTAPFSGFTSPKR